MAMAMAMAMVMFNRILTTAAILSLLVGFYSGAEENKTPLSVGATTNEMLFVSFPLQSIVSKSYVENAIELLAPEEFDVKFRYFRSKELLDAAFREGELDAIVHQNNRLDSDKASLEVDLYDDRIIAYTLNEKISIETAISQSYQFVVPVNYDWWRGQVGELVGSEKVVVRRLVDSVMNLSEREVLLIPFQVANKLPPLLQAKLNTMVRVSSPELNRARFTFRFAAQAKEKYHQLTRSGKTLSPADVDRLLRESLKNKYYAGSSNYKLRERKIALTDEEAEWIRQNPIVRYAGTNSVLSAPYDIIEMDGSHSGISADYLKLIGQLTGLRFEYVGAYNGDQTELGFYEKSWDLFTVMPEYMRNYFPFFAMSREYAYFSFVVVTRKTLSLETKEDLIPLRFATGLNSGTAKFRRMHPQVETIEVHSIEDALTAIESGQADFTLLTSHSTDMHIKNGFENTLTTAFAVNILDTSVHFATRKDLDTLRQIIDKALLAITAETHQQIRTKWFGSNHSVRLDWKQVALQSWPFILATVLLILTLLFWSRKLRREVSIRRKVQAQLEVSRVQAEQATQAKSLFLSTMSHEIRTPINGIVGMLEMMMDTKLNHEQQHMLRAVNQSSSSLLQIINDILDFSKIEAGKLQVENIPFNIGRGVESICELMANLAWDKGINFYLSIDPALYEDKYIGDPVRLRQVVMNLVSNAIKFTEQGQVSLIVQIDESSDSASHISLYVKDTGIGMAPEQVEKLFTPFTQAESSTTRRFGGTGLGLAISHKLTELMGMDLSVKSEQGQGSVFTLSGTFLRKAMEPQIPLWQPSCLIVNQNRALEKLLKDYLSAWHMPAQWTSAENSVEDIVSMASRVEIVMVNQQEAERQHLDTAELAKRIPGKLICMTQQSRFDSRQLCINPLIPGQLRLLLSDDKAVPNKETGNDIRISHLTREQAEIQGCMILVAEDHPTNRMVLRKQLERLGIHADFVEDGELAWQSWLHKNYGLLLTDCHMPKKDGYQLSREIRELESMTMERKPIVALTASVLEHDKIKCLDAGMDEVLTKPVNLEQLSVMLKSYLLQESHSDSPQTERSEEFVGPQNQTQGTVSAADVSVAGQNNGYSRAGTPAVKEYYDKQQLVSLFGDAWQAVLYEFSLALQSDISELNRSCELHESHKVADICHRIKGAAQTIHAIPLASIAGDIESLARESDKSMKGIELSELLHIARATLTQIESALASMSGAA